MSKLGILLNFLQFFCFSILTAVVVVFLHRIYINSILPFGFIIAIVFLFVTSVIVRGFALKNSFFNKSSKLIVNLFGLSTSFFVLFIALNQGQNFLVIAQSLSGEKSYSGTLGIILVSASFLIPFISTILPDNMCRILDIISLPAKFYDSEISLLNSIVNITDSVLENAYYSKLDFSKLEYKADNSVVTEIDKQVEKIIIREILKKFPNDSILGEEFGETKKNNRRWIIDPIDGTANFVRKVPIFATLIALEVDGKPKKSVVSAPLLNRRWISNGIDSFEINTSNNKTTKMIANNNCKSIKDAFFSYSSIAGWKKLNKLEKIIDLQSDSKRSRAFGDFYQYMLLANGSIDIATEPDLQVYDIAALIPILEGAKAVYSDIDGEFWKNDSGIKSLVVASSLELHNEAIDKLKGE